MDVCLDQGYAVSHFILAVVRGVITEEAGLLIINGTTYLIMMFADDIVVTNGIVITILEIELERWRFALERRRMTGQSRGLLIRPLLCKCVNNQEKRRPSLKL